MGLPPSDLEGEGYLGLVGLGIL